MYKSFKLVLIFLLGWSLSGSAQTIIYNQAFIGGSTPTTQCTAWNTFRALLLPTLTYTGFTISGSLDPIGISCNDPVIALNVANALRTGTPYSVFDATATPMGPQTWTVGLGCTTGLGCSPATAVEFGNIGTCACLSGYDLRPAIGNNNWGGIGPTCGAASQTLIVTFRAGPAAPTITGDSVYCIGDTIMLTASSTAPGPTYSWTGPSSFTATTASISIIASPATAGVYSCTVTSASITSFPSLDTISVIAPPTITLGANPVICQGTPFATLPYSATTSSPNKFSIVFDPGALGVGFAHITGATLPTSPITLAVPGGAPPGVYTGTLSVDNGVCTGPGYPISITINPNPAPITGVPNTCTGSTTTLADATPGGVWSSSNTGIATVGTSGVVTGVAVGSATISYTMPSGCFAYTLVNVVGISGPTKVCMGDSVTLTATGGSGAWSSGDVTLATVGAGTGVVTGVAMGIVPISYTLSSGCVATWIMSVNPLAPIVGRDSVCLGSDRWLTNIVGGGTWTSSFPGIASVLPDSGKVTGLVAGITNISYTLPTGCMSWRRFTVIDYPNAITGTKRACPGTTTTLSNSTGGGRWSTGNPGVALVGATSGVVTGVFADTVNIYYTIEPGCAVAAHVTINPLPAPIEGIDAMCPNTKDTLEDATPYGLWTSGTPPIMSVIDTSGIITAISQGTARITYTLVATGCYRVKTVSVFPIPVPGITYNFNTNTLIAAPGYVTYQWYDSIQGQIPGATSPTIAALNTEYYYVEVTDSNGCKGQSALYHFDVNWLGINTVEGDKIRIYPNPASELLHIESLVKVRAVISSIDGRKVMDQADAKDMDISKLVNGMYMITLYNDQGTRISVQKFTKE